MMLIIVVAIACVVFRKSTDVGFRLGLLGDCSIFRPPPLTTMIVRSLLMYSETAIALYSLVLFGIYRAFIAPLFH